MSYKWPDKDKNETLDYSVDWSRILVNTTITSVTWFIQDATGTPIQVDPTDVVNGLQMIAQTNTSTVATINLGLGTNNIKYNIICRIGTSNGLQFERTIVLGIKDK
jgi:hypothetical protein